MDRVSGLIRARPVVSPADVPPALAAAAPDEQGAPELAAPQRAAAPEEEAREHTMPLTPYTQVAAMTQLPRADAATGASGQNTGPRGLARRVKLAVLGAPAGLAVPGLQNGLVARRAPAIMPTAAGVTATTAITPATAGITPGAAAPGTPAATEEMAAPAPDSLALLLNQGRDRLNQGRDRLNHGRDRLNHGRDRLNQTVSPALSPLADLADDPRLTRWIRRAAACVVVGGALVILVNLPVGLLGAAVVAVTDLLYQSRTSAAIPAALRAPSAQRRTRRRLARLASSGYLSLHARAIPGTGAVIDHLVVGPGGIYAVDSEVWDRRLPVRALRGGDGLFHGPFDQSARLDEARWEAGEASRLMSEAIGQPVAIRPAMVIYGPAVPWVMMKISGVDVFCGNRLRKYLRREASANHTWRLDDRQTEAFHAVAAEVLPPAH